MKKQKEEKQDGLPPQDELQNNAASVTEEPTAEQSVPAAEEAASVTEVPEEVPAEENATAEGDTVAEESATAEATAAEGKRARKTKNTKKQQSGKMHGKKIAIITLSSILAVVILAVSLLLGIGSCNKTGMITPPDINTTVRKETPTDGSTPADHVALDNIAYMAYVLDRQPYYHAYAHNSTKSTGYEQITQTWKDYRMQEVNGKNRGIMVCSDLSYSALVKSATQTCFVDNSVAYMRTGSKPLKQSVATDLDWNTDQPRKYEREEYLNTYGEFSTELSVYVINESTVESAGEVVDNGDGTYSQTYTLNEGAACWYQYGMKTRGGLKTYPKFEKIEITFTFDGKWQVLSTYCEEVATIAPGALGGFPMGSNSKTTTTWNYGEPDFDAVHFGYFDGYYSAFLDKDINNDGDGYDDVVLTDVLAGGFGKVLNGGQQFALGLNVGETVYDGKIYLKLDELDDVLGTLEVRFALEKHGSGRQDLYAEFSKGAVNLYYSDGFALTADIDKVSASVKAVSEWINGILGGGDEGEPAPQADGGLDLGSLMGALKFEPSRLGPDDKEVKISIDTDDLLGLGIGVNLEMNFDRSKEDGINTYAFNNLKLNGLSFNSSKLALSGNIVPDETEVISRDPSQTPADIADYIDGVLALANSKSYLINLGLDGSAEGIEALNGLKLEAAAQVELSSDYKNIKVNAPISVDYKNLSAQLSVYYTVNLKSGDYGDVYINLTNVCGKEVSAKVCCNIKDLVSSVNKLISMFTAPETRTGETDTPAVDGQTKMTVAEIINTVLHLDFGAIVTELKADENEIKVSVNADEILKTVLLILNKQFDIELGTATVSASLSGGKVSLKGSVSALGLAIGINGSDEAVPEIDAEGYADVTSYVNGVYNLLNSETYEIKLTLDGTCNSIEYLKDATASATAYVKTGSGFKTVDVSVPEIKINYQGLTVTLGLYYTINLDDGGYGKVYVSLTELGGKEVSANIYCDVKDTVKAVTSLINSFKTGQEAPATVYANVIDTVLSIDFGAIITELKISAEEVKLGANADEILKAFNVNLGMNFGDVTLRLGLTGGKANLSCSLASFGLGIEVNGSDKVIAVPDASGYADITEYVDGVANFLASNTFAVSVNLDGTCNSIEYVKGVSVNADALVKANKNFTEIEVYVPALTVSYQGLTVVLDINYSINLTSGGYGRVYLNVTEVGGAAVSAKVYCEISETVEAVMKIVEMFAKKEEPSPAATYAADGGSDKIAQVIGKIVSIDFNALIGTLTADGTGINAAVNADEILNLLNINLSGIKLGTASVSVTLDGGKLAVSGAVNDLGLTLGLSGSDKIIPAVNTESYADLTSYVNGVYNLLNSNSYKLTLSFNGAECTAVDGVNAVKDYVKKVTADAVAQVKLSPDFKTVTVNAPLTVRYGKSFSAELEIYYTLEIGSGYGNVYISLNRINEQAFSARVSCGVNETVSAVRELIALFSEDKADGETQDGELSVAALAVGDIVGKIVSLDFKKIILLLTADNTGVNLTVSADEILSAFNVNVGGVQFGNVLLELGVDGNNCATLSGSVPVLGLTVLKLNGSDKDIPSIPEEKYLDIAELVNLVKTAAVEVKQIIAANAIVFDVAKADLTVDGVKMSVAGSGEASWANKTARVALDLAFSISEGAASEDVNVKFVYDEAAEHLVRFTINKLGLVIDKNDIDSLSDGINQIINVIGSLTGGSAKTAGAAAYAEYGEETPDAMTAVLNAVLEFASGLKVELIAAENAGEGAVKELVVSYAENGVLTLGANGGLSLNLLVKNNGGTEIADISASVHAPEAGEDKFSVINKEFDAENGYKFYASSEEKQFTEAVYDYLFEVLKDLSVKDLLASDTYTVTVKLDGDASGIDALKGISVNAELYYTETEDGKKIVEIEINELNIKGTAVVANASYFDGYFYIRLMQIGETKLYNSYTDAEINKPLAFKASKDDIYGAVDAIVRIITSENASAIISLFNGNGAAAAAALAENGGAAAPAVGTNATLNKILNAIFKLAIDFKKVDGENTLTLNIDGILDELGLGVALGDVKVSVNPVTHALSVSAVKGGTAWVTLNAFADAESKHGIAPAAEDFIDIGFVSTLLGDLETTLGSLGEREDGKPDLRISLTGELKIDISYSVISTNVTVKDVVLTAGLDEENNFFFSVKGNLQESNAKISILPLPVTVAKAMPVSITYSSGYITMGRTNDKGENIYKVMTLEYLIDNVLDKNTSPIRWWLGTNETVWGLICDNVKLPINSGLTDKQEYYLYEHETDIPDETPAEPEDKIFNLAAMLLGLDVKLGGYNSLFGSEIAKFSGVTDNYYSVLIDLSSLLGNSFTPLRAAIVRNAEGGLKGLDAYVALKDGNKEVLKINVGLDNGVITKETATAKHAEDTFKTVTANHDIDYDYYSHTTDKRFGCYSTEDGTYDYSEYNKKYKVEVFDFEEDCDLSTIPVNERGTKRTHYVQLNSGSTVYMLPEEQWLNEEHTRKLIYVDENGNDLGLTLTVKADTKIYMMIVGKSEIRFFDADENACNVVGSDSNVMYDILTGETLPEPQSATVSKDGVSYSFAGWYTEKECVTSTNSVQAGVSSYYAKYVLTDVTESNGITYKFSTDGGYHYSVTGFDNDVAKNKENIDYTLATATLKISSVVNGYPVTAIGHSAFKATNIKNVVVPESVVTVGAQAFMDNYGMETAVFLANSVYLGGGSATGDNRWVFFGCSLKNGSNDTKLHIYYNNFTMEDVNNWDCVRTDVHIGRNGLGGKHNSGWGYAVYKISGIDNLECVHDGLTTAFLTADSIKEAVMSELNSNTCSEGKIFAYNVEVTGDCALNGKLNNIGIVVTAAEKPFYLVTVDCATVGAVINELADGEVEIYDDGAIYVKAGATVKLTPPDGYVFENVSVGDKHGEDDYFTFTMTKQPLVISATCKKAPIRNVNISSQIAFRYGNNDYAAGIHVLNGVNEGATLSTPTADGYYFLGWSWNNAGTLNFTVSTVQYQTYYAVWGVEKDQIESVKELTEGSNPNDYLSNVNVNKNLCEGIYKWYADAEFTKVANALTISTTVLYARMSFNVTYSLTGDYAYYFVNVASNDPKKGDAVGEGKNFAQSYSVLENAEVSVAYTGTDGKKEVVIKIDGNQYVLRVKDRKLGWGYEAGSSQEMMFVGLTTENGWKRVGEAYVTTVKGNVTININH